METLERLVTRLTQLPGDKDREAFICDNPVLTTVEGARVLCRSAVALTARDLALAERLCDSLDRIATTTPEMAVHGYRDHARAACLHHAGSDLRRAAALWVTAIQCFGNAALPAEAAITSSCAIPDLGVIGEIELLWRCERRARSYFEAQGDRLRLAKLRMNVSSVFFSRAEWSTAACLLELSHEDLIAQRFGGVELITIMTNLAACYVHLGELPRATYLLEKAQNLCRERGIDPDLTLVSNNLASASFLAGDLGSTLELVRQQLERWRPDSRLYYHTTLTEADVLLDLCLPIQAQRAASLAYQGLGRIGATLEAAKALLTSGRCLAACRRLTSAVQIFDRARALFLGLESPQGARWCDIEKARALLDLGDVQASAALVKETFKSPSTTWVEADLDFSLLRVRILLSNGEVQRARALAEEVVASSAICAHSSLEGKALRLLGEIYESLGLRELAHDVLLRSQRSIEAVRRDLPTAEMQIAFLTDKSDVFESLFCLGLPSSRPDALFHLVETSRSRTLTESLAFKVGPQPVDNGHQELIEVWDGLRGSLSKLDRLAEGMPSGTVVDPIRQGILAAERATRELLRKVSNGRDGDGTEAPTLGEIAASLPDHSTLVEFYQARGRMFAFVLSPEALELRELGLASEIQSLCRLSLFALQRVRHPNCGRDDRALLTYLENIYRLLWSEIAPFVTSERLIIVPHGFLHQFPLHALFDGQCFLTERHAITYSPSASVFHMTRKRTKQPTQGSIIVGLPDTSMPAVAEEVHELSRILPDSRVFLNGAATRERLAAEMPSARFIHIAAHGGFNAAHPHSSSVSLDDGPITVHDLQRMELTAELVVLSGCETGRTALRGCDELVGLTQALLQAGAHSALVSLWNVADRATSALMRSFFEGLKSKLSRDESLRRAMAIQRGNFPSPSLWAPFVLVGDPDPGITVHDSPFQ